jgi:hypothetical protein
LFAESEPDLEKHDLLKRLEHGPKFGDDDAAAADGMTRDMRSGIMAGVAIDVAMLVVVFLSSNVL